MDYVPENYVEILSSGYVVAVLKLVGFMLVKIRLSSVLQSAPFLAID
jgi:hypothetical protein